MEIRSIKPEHWPAFVELASLEGWRVPPQELALFKGELADCAFCLSCEAEPRGFVTALVHQRSGWIGNLIVPAEFRGRGYGRLLFRHGLEVLEARGVESVWLTASPMGRPLYEQHGFQVIGGIERWSLAVVGSELPPCAPPGDASLLLAGDALVWGESRQRLLSPLAGGGQVLAVGNSVALLQQAGPLQVLGPWISPELCPRENRQLLMAVLAAAGAGVELVVDLLETSPVRMLLSAAGFTPKGRCDLMARGPREGVELAPLVALASLGSMG
ncbi:N-acetyltransferase [Desulfuromonas versatilis]|uniref:N-acetyltransferase n=1 Tax=Desulfuromonas versatilis TaxID=2802975 RepID=A0ABM8I1D2_9BACT|nr:GNAT family N-acetyltransferase [Desulfuromonas versatilis]BCR06527.1 N-acetyltransferase [Desulfuromonas versatilis]